MTRSRALTVLVAALAVSALGVTATSLEATLSTSPDEAIDLDFDRLPIGEDDAAAVKEEIEGGDEGGEAGQSSDAAPPDAEGSGSAESAADAPDAGDGATGPAEQGDGSDAQSSGGDGSGDRSSDDVGTSDRSSGGAGTEETASVGGSGDDAGLDPGEGAAVSGEESLLDRLLRLLRTLLPLALLLALGWLAHRYRDRLLSLLGLGSADEPPAGSEAGPEAWPGGDPSTAVDRAWVTLVRRADPERPETTTTDECRALARERGLDREGVEAIATAFERVHYGGAPAAEEAERARAGLRRLGADDGPRRADGGSE